ncbi:MAG TPA: type II toxin-antitoxin system RelE/ParE family toxin [Streptosporangiaceae bacterium]|jgi:hypothetical protein
MLPIGFPAAPMARQARGSHLLRPLSSGSTKIRLLFAFNPWREAIFLVAGDKAGNCDSWYREAIMLADQRYALHLKATDAGSP